MEKFTQLRPIGGRRATSCGGIPTRVLTLRLNPKLRTWDERQKNSAGDASKLERPVINKLCYHSRAKESWACSASQKVTAAPPNNHKVWVKRNEPTNQTAPEFLKPTHQSAAVHVIISLPPQNSKTKQTHKECMIIRSLKTTTDYHPRPPPPPSAPNCSPLPVLICWKSVKLWMVYITHLHLPTIILTRFNSERALENCIDTNSLGSLY